MKKQVLSLALAMTLCLGLAPVTTFASESDFNIKDNVLRYYSGTDTNVVIPAGVTSIGENAFAEMNLTSVVIPDSVTSIGVGAFYGTDLESVVIPDSVTHIGGMAFQECAALKSVTIGNGLTYIEPQTFYGCTGLDDLHIGSNVEAIGTMAFEHCSSLKTLVIPENVGYIDNAAFYGCTALSQLTISSNTVCDSSAFSECPNLPAGLVPNGSWKEIYGGEEKKVGDFIIHGETLTKYVGPGGDVVIPEGVTIIAPGAFYECGTLKSITIADTVKRIDNCAFYNCSGLETVIFPTQEKLTPALKYISLFSTFSSANIQRIVNSPDNSVYERLAQNEQLRKMWTDADPSICVLPQSERIVVLSNQICAGHTSDYEKARAIYDWMAENIVYDFPYYYGEKETVTIFPEEVLDSKLTICDGYSRLTQALLQAQGIPALRVIGPATGRITDVGEIHAWNMAYVDGRWIYIDSTWGRKENNDPQQGEPEYFSTDAWFDPAPLFFSISHQGETSVIDPNGHHDDTPRPAASATATPNRSTVLVNGQSVAFDAYTINQNNYFKLRDLAKILSGTAKQFEVTWDGERNAIDMVSGQPYTVVGGEMAQGDGVDKTASLNTAIIYLDGQPVQLTAYTINQNNYFKLRDLGTAFDFDVTWDGANNCIYIDTTRGYTAE